MIRDNDNNKNNNSNNNNNNNNAKKGYIFEVKKSPDRNILRVRSIFSKHSSNKKYASYVKFDQQAITGWYCTCPLGLKTVNPCVHCSSIIFYFGYARHNPEALQCNAVTVIPKISKRKSCDDLTTPNNKKRK